MAQVSLIPVLLWVAALLCAGVAIWRGKRPVTRDFVFDRLLRYLFLFPLGVQGLWAFVGHVFFAEEAAASIGWPNTPFQYEVGVANLGLALASFYAAFRGFEARLAAALAASCFLVGAGIIHIVDIVAKGNFAPGNAGPIMVTDFLTPIVILVLLLAIAQKPRPKSLATLQLEAELESAQRAMRTYRDALSELGKE